MKVWDYVSHELAQEAGTTLVCPSDLPEDWAPGSIWSTDGPPGTWVAFMRDDTHTHLSAWLCEADHSPQGGPALVTGYVRRFTIPYSDLSSGPALGPWLSRIVYWLAHGLIHDEAPKSRIKIKRKAAAL